MDLLRQAHDVLGATRGAAISLASVTPADAHLEWIGVGNVQGTVVHPSRGRSTRLVTRGGVVGGRLPPLRSTSVELARGDLIVLFTDGLRDDVTSDLARPDDPQQLAEHLLAAHATSNDDALILVARYAPPLA